MIISVVEILKDQEITVPFDQEAGLPGYFDCACGKETCSLLNKETIKKEILAEPIAKETVTNEVGSVVKTEMNEQHLIAESENDSSAGDESRNEKLTREERKLQAYVKQFEKLEKKSDTAKNKKDGKAAGSRSTSTDEVVSTASVTPQKPALVKYVCFSLLYNSIRFHFGNYEENFFFKWLVFLHIDLVSLLFYFTRKLSTKRKISTSINGKR